MKTYESTRKIQTIGNGMTKFFHVTVLMLFLTGCTAFKPVSGGVEQSDGSFLLDSDGVQVTVFEGGTSPKFGCVEIDIRNNSDSPAEIDYMQSVITTDSGEQIQALTPDDVRALAPVLGKSNEISETAIVKSTIQSNESIKGNILFKTPANPYETINFQFVGFPGSPNVSFARQ